MAFNSEILDFSNQQVLLTCLRYSEVSIPFIWNSLFSRCLNLLLVIPKNRGRRPRLTLSATEPHMHLEYLEYAPVCRSSPVILNFRPITVKLAQMSGTPLWSEVTTHCSPLPPISSVTSKTLSLAHHSLLRFHFHFHFHPRPKMSFVGSPVHIMDPVEPVHGTRDPCGRSCASPVSKFRWTLRKHL